MSARFTDREVQVLLALPRPDTKVMMDAKETVLLAINDRVSALVELIHGAAIKAVAERYGLHRKTLRRMLDLAVQPGLDGSMLGFAVCIPGARLVDPRPRISAY